MSDKPTGCKVMKGIKGSSEIYEMIVTTKTEAKLVVLTFWSSRVPPYLTVISPNLNGKSFLQGSIGTFGAPPDKAHMLVFAN